MVTVATVKVGRQGQLKHISPFKVLFITPENELSNNINIKFFLVFILFHYSSFKNNIGFRRFRGLPFHGLTIPSETL